jgi:hypothetical protein
LRQNLAKAVAYSFLRDLNLTWHDLARGGMKPSLRRFPMVNLPSRV